MTQTLTSKVWGLNTNGEIVATQGTGSSTVDGFLAQDYLPVDATGKVSLLMTDSNGSMLSFKADAVTAFGLRKGIATPLLLYVNQANFTISGTGATKADSYSPLLSPQAVTVNGSTSTLSSTNLDRVGLNLNINSLDDFQIAFHTATPAVFNGLSVFLCSDASGFTNFVKVELMGTGMYGHKNTGWNILGWKKSEMVTTGNPDLTSIKQIRTQIYSAAGNAVVTVDSIWANTKTRAKAMVMFDDGWTEAYDFNNGQGMFTYMQSKGLKGTMGIIGGLIGVSSYMTHSQLQTIYGAGWDLSVHGVQYNGTVPNYQDLTLFPTEAEAITNIKFNRNFLISNGYTRASDFYIFPQGKYTETLIPAMRDMGIKSARATYETQVYSYFAPSDYLMKLPGVDLGGKTFAQVKPYIDRAIATGGTIILYGHRLQIAAGGAGMYMTVSEFTQVIDYLAANKTVIDTVTYSDWYAQVVSTKVV